MTDHQQLYDTCGSSSISSRISGNNTISTTSTSSSTTTHTQPGVLSEIEKGVICDAYRASIGIAIPAPVAFLIGNLRAKGMAVDVIIHAIDMTGWARRPSPWYLRAILQRYDRQRLYTMEQVLHDEDEFAAANGPSDELPW